MALGEYWKFPFKICNLFRAWEDRDSWIVIENLPSYCMVVARNLALRETYSGNKERMERYAVR